MEQKISARKLGIFLMFTYMVSYLTRINFGAVIVEMVSATGYSKSQLSWALTGSFVTYGVGQVISGWFGDKIQPKKLVFWGLLFSVCMNILVPLFTNPYIITVLWCLNGLAQAFMWPPILKILVNSLTEEEYSSTTVIVAYGGAFGTILIYMIAPLIIYIAGWRGVFFFSAICGVIMMLFWQKYCPKVSVVSSKQKTSTEGLGKLMLSPMMIAILLAIIFQGALRDGITTWMPSYISETYKLENGKAIFTGVLLPIFTLICLGFAQKVYIRFFKSPITCGAVIFAVGAVAAFALYAFTGHNPIMSVLYSALLTGSMHGVNFMLISIVPSFFKSKSYVSFISGILNAGTYVGSAISTYGIAVLTESKGWNFTIAIWCLIAVVGTVLCFICVPAWRRFTQNRGSIVPKVKNNDSIANI